MHLAKPSTCFISLQMYEIGIIIIIILQMINESKKLSLLPNTHGQQRRSGKSDLNPGILIPEGRHINSLLCYSLVVVWHPRSKQAIRRQSLGSRKSEDAHRTSGQGWGLGHGLLGELTRRRGWGRANVPRQRLSKHEELREPKQLCIPETRGQEVAGACWEMIMNE